jgi:hypothetical protein
MSQLIKDENGIDARYSKKGTVTFHVSNYKVCLTKLWISKNFVNGLGLKGYCILFELDPRICLIHLCEI